MSQSPLKFAHFPYIARLVSADRVPKARRLSVLDVGCGPGTLVSHCPLPLRADLYGLDLWPHQLHQAASKGLYAGLVQANLVDGIPFRKESFDIIVCGEILMYLPNAQQILEACYTLLRPEGTLLLYNPISQFPRLVGNLKKFWRKIYQEKASIALDRQHNWKGSTRACRVTYYKLSSLVEQVSQTGFSVENIAAFRLSLNRLRVLNRLEDCGWYRCATEYLTRRYPQLATDILIEARKGGSTKTEAVLDAAMIS